MTGQGTAAGSETSRALADRLVSTLGDRPFAPSADQLAWVGGGDPLPGQENGPLARVAAGRYAGLFADHLVRDVTVDGAPGAYVRIWLCARRAFLRAEGGAGRAGSD